MVATVFSLHFPELPKNGSFSYRCKQLNFATYRRENHHVQRAPLTLTEKVLYSHLDDSETVSSTKTGE